MESRRLVLSVVHLYLVLWAGRCQGQYENVALNKVCDITSRTAVKPDCGLAVDGDNDTCIEADSTTSTLGWAVNLGRPYPVCNITIWTSPLKLDDLQGVEVYVNSTLYYTFQEAPTQTRFTIYSRNPPWVGTNITLLGNSEFTICEVEILSCSDPYWGSKCNETCGHCANSQVCHKVTGHCDSCLPGWEPPFCTVCSDGYWGDTCKARCGRCGMSQVCDKVSGHCSSCQDGWGLPLCTDCRDGYWGDGCNQTCGTCGEGQVCDKVSGHCPTCSPGWQPPRCDTDCSDSNWGNACNQTCGRCGEGQVCDKVSGYCPTCSPGWQPPRCDTVCADGQWGGQCNETCGHCADSQVCHKVTGHCDTCSQGWQPPFCADCSDGYWGDACNQTCGNCSDSQVCDKVTGRCPQCSPESALPLCPQGTTQTESRISVGVVVGAVVGAVVGLALVITLVILLVRRHKSGQHNNGTRAAEARDTTRPAPAETGVVRPMPRQPAQPEAPGHSDPTAHSDPTDHTDHRYQTAQSRVAEDSDYLQLDPNPPLYSRLSTRTSQHVYNDLNG